jgi:hypothetical protein
MPPTITVSHEIANMVVVVQSATRHV